jgi:hypothetical protein
VNDRLDVKGNYEHVPDFALHMPRPFFPVSVSLVFLCMAHAFFPERLSNQCQGLHCTFSDICTKLYAVPSSVKFHTSDT